MARGRQLNRIKFKRPSDTALKRYLHDWDAKSLISNIKEFPRLTSIGIFGNHAPLEVEIGPGTGEFIFASAAENPQVNYLGIEASRRAVYHAVNLGSRTGLTNLRFVRANVKLLYPLLESESWSKSYLHFPDPIHKRRDKKHRVFDQDFLDAMDLTLISGGEISVVSDKEDFFFEMLKLAERDARFEKAHDERYLVGYEEGVKSRFQRFWERKGVRPMHFILRKKAIID